MSEKHLEKHTGINGKGQEVFLIVTVKNSEWLWIETFTNEVEADSWMRWA